MNKVKRNVKESSANQTFLWNHGGAGQNQISILSLFSERIDGENWNKTNDCLVNRLRLSQVDLLICFVFSKNQAAAFLI